MYQRSGEPMFFSLHGIVENLIILQWYNFSCFLIKDAKKHVASFDSWSFEFLNMKINMKGADRQNNVQIVGLLMAT